MTDEQFVINIYSSLLHRSPAEEEVKHWANMLAGGMSRSDVVETFMSSSEFISLQTQKERFRVSFPGPTDGSRFEQDVISVLQNHVVRQRSLGYEEPSRVRSHPVQTQPRPQPVPVDPLQLENLQPQPSDTDLSSRMAEVSARVQRAQQEVGQLNPRSPGLVSSLAQAVKRTLQRSLTWYTRSLQHFNEQVANALNEHAAWIVGIEQSLRRSDDRMRDHVNRQAFRLNQEASRLNQEIGRLNQEIWQQNEEALFLKDQTSRLNEEISRLDRTLAKLQTDYLDRMVRETELATQEHFIPYLAYFRERSPVVDIGCGRGEFLALLKDNGIESYGVDLDEDSCDIARRKSLRVIHNDFFELLRQLPDRSLGGIFSARVMEFVPPPQQVELISLCSQKLKPGGVLLMETTNPDSRRGYGRLLNLDATHFRPVPPEIMKSALESNSFDDVKIVFPGCVEVAADQGDDKGQSRAANAAGVSDSWKAGPVYAVVGKRI